MGNLTATRERLHSNYEQETEDIRPIPKELLVGALEYLDRARGTSHMVDHEEVKSIIYKRMGWN